MEKKTKKTAAKTKPTQAMFVDDVESNEEDLVVEQQEKQTPPKANVIELPSNGAFGYPREVEYREMMVKDEEILSMATGENYSKVLNGVLKSVLNDCPFYENITTHDRDFLLIWIWANNYESKKHLTVTCENTNDMGDVCGHVNNVTVDLTKLDISNPREKFTGAIEVTLKKTGKPIKIRLNTVRDELDTEAFLSSEAGKNQKYDHLMNVASLDLGIDTSLENKLKWVRDNVSAKEMALVRKFHKSLAYGVKTMLSHTCEKCGGETHYVLPFQVSDVLYPDLSIDIEEYL